MCLQSEKQRPLGHLRGAVHSIWVRSRNVYFVFTRLRGGPLRKRLQDIGCGASGQLSLYKRSCSPPPLHRHLGYHVAGRGFSSTPEPTVMILKLYPFYSGEPLTPKPLRALQCPAGLSALLLSVSRRKLPDFFGFYFILI